MHILINISLTNPFKVKAGIGNSHCDSDRQWKINLKIISLIMSFCEQHHLLFLIWSIHQYHIFYWTYWSLSLKVHNPCSSFFVESRFFIYQFYYPSVFSILVNFIKFLQVFTLVRSNQITIVVVRRNYIYFKASRRKGESYLVLVAYCSQHAAICIKGIIIKIPKITCEVTLKSSSIFFL